MTLLRPLRRPGRDRSADRLIKRFRESVIGDDTGTSRWRRPPRPPFAPRRAPGRQFRADARRDLAEAAGRIGAAEEAEQARAEALALYREKGAVAAARRLSAVPSR